MQFCFGIITNGNEDYRVNFIIDSIERQRIPEYEIIVVGPKSYERSRVKSIIFKDNKPWITKKKNLITENSQYNNIVYLHDYYSFTENWYQGQLIAGDIFDVRMDKIVNIDGTRFRDWCIWPHNNNKMDEIIGRECLIPYSIDFLSKYMYISGGYWIAKKHVMQEFPLDESLIWGQSEDVKWSQEVREKYKFSMNPFSTVKLIKWGKDRVFKEASEETINKIYKFCDKINNI